MNIKVKNLYFNYYKRPLCLSGLNFSLDNNSKSMIFASKDMGKTTLLKILAGFEDNYVGQICVCDKDIKTISDQNLSVSLLLSKPVLLENKNIKQNIDFLCKTCGIHLIGFEKLNTMLSEFGLNVNSKTKVKYLNLFQKRMLAIFRCEIKMPKFVFVDDQFDGLVDENEIKIIFNKIKEILKSQNQTVVSAFEKESILKFESCFSEFNFDNYFYLCDSKLIFNKQFEKFFTNPENLDIISFCDKFDTTDGFIIKQDGFFYFANDDGNMVKFDKMFDIYLDNLKLNELENENCVAAVLKKNKFDLFDNKLFNLNLGKNVFWIMSKIDGKRIV